MIAIRVDGNGDIGIGHIMRCMSIAGALVENGVEVLFITCDNLAEEIILKNGYNLQKINGAYNDLELQLIETVDILDKYCIEKILIDSYYITDKYVNEISEYSKVILLGSMKKVFKNISMIINYSCTYDREFYNKNYADSICLLGPKYTPMRKEFLKYRCVVKNDIENILITTGGTQKNTMCYGILKGIMGSRFKGKCTLIVSGKCREIDELEQHASLHNNVVVLKNINNMAEVMSQNDLLITAAGTTMYECCAIGIPAITFALVDEQEADGIKLKQLTGMGYCGNVEKDGRENVLNNIKGQLKKMREYNVRYEMSNTMKKVINGAGNTNIAMEMIKL